MNDGLVLPAGGGRRIEGTGLTLKVGADRSQHWSMFEAVVPPGFDVGAHHHSEAEEVFYVLEGELDLLAFQPESTDDPNWRNWRSTTGATVTRGGPGSTLVVPAGCPHAFSNPGTVTARMLFLVAPPGHEYYLEEMAALRATGDPPSPDVIRDIRARHDIIQLTPPRPGAGQPGPPGRPGRA